MGRNNLVIFWITFTEQFHHLQFGGQQILLKEKVPVVRYRTKQEQLPRTVHTAPLLGSPCSYTQDQARWQILCKKIPQVKFFTTSSTAVKFGTKVHKFQNEKLALENPNCQNSEIRFRNN